MGEKRVFDVVDENLDKIEECADKIRFVQDLLKDYSTIPIREYGAKLDYLEDNLRAIEKSADEIGKVIKESGADVIDGEYKDNQIYKFYKEDIHKFRAAYWRFLSNHKNALLRRYVAMAALNAPPSKWPWESEYFNKDQDTKDKLITNPLAITNRTIPSQLYHHKSNANMDNILKESKEQITKEMKERQEAEEKRQEEINKYRKAYQENPTPESIQDYIDHIYYQGDTRNDRIPTVTEFMRFMKDTYESHHIKLAGNYNKFAHKDYNAVRYGSKLAIYDKSLETIMKGRWPEISNNDIKVLYGELEYAGIILKRDLQITKVNNALKYPINFIGFSIDRLKLYGVLKWKR